MKRAKLQLRFVKVTINYTLKQGIQFNYATFLYLALNILYWFGDLSHLLKADKAI
jgi:hypothetical protein